MMMRCRSGVLTSIVLSALLAVGSAESGVFLYSTSTIFEHYLVMHPTGYNGAGGVLEVRICSAPETRHATLFAIDKWNALDRTTGNCSGCRLWEEGGSGSDAPRSMENTMLHELGHCAMGLDHVNWMDNGGVQMSYTNGDAINFYTDGLDGVRGSSDDGVSPPAGARVVHWFRSADNDPFVIDSTVIDISTYSRQKIDLPSGHSWQASGNRGVGDLLGLTDTQTVMYSASDPLQVYSGLTADDVNTVEFARSGLDETAGTADDYTVSLIYVDDCAMADIEVNFEPLPLLPNALGNCAVDAVSLEPGQMFEIHHALRPFLGDSRILLTINSDKDWDSSVFGDGFEDGTTSGWTLTVP